MVCSQVEEYTNVGQSGIVYEPNKPATEVAFHILFLSNKRLLSTYGAAVSVTTMSSKKWFPHWGASKGGRASDCSKV